MAATLVLDFNNVPVGTPLTGNMVVTNGGGVDIGLIAASVGLVSFDNSVSRPGMVHIPLPNSGSGSAGPNFNIPAGASVSLSFTIPSFVGTLAAQVFVTDGSNPTTTATVTPV